MAKETKETVRDIVKLGRSVTTLGYILEMRRVCEKTRGLDYNNSRVHATVVVVADVAYRTIYFIYGYGGT